jgi:large conductance mechanosensitive channel
MKKMIQEFREFAARGNVVDMAVGIIIGGAFGKIVSSLVADVIMPPIGLLLGGVDFGSLVITLRAASEGVAAVTLNYGSFLQAIVDFLIVAWAVFLLVRGVNAMRRKEEVKPAAPPEPPADVKLLGEIRDLLKAGR